MARIMAHRARHVLQEGTTGACVLAKRGRHCAGTPAQSRRLGAHGQIKVVGRGLTAMRGGPRIAMQQLEELASASNPRQAAGYSLLRLTDSCAAACVMSNRCCTCVAPASLPRLATHPLSHGRHAKTTPAS